jgi:hypothetical protein
MKVEAKNTHRTTQRNATKGWAMFGFELLLILGGLVCLGTLGFGTVLLLIQLGVIFKKATEEPYRDQGNYTIDQGRDVGKQE